MRPRRAPYDRPTAIRPAATSLRPNDLPGGRALRSFMLVATAAGILLTGTNRARAAEMWLSGTEYDPAIPTFEKVLGHGPAEAIVSHGELTDYFRALSAAAPDRLRIVPYAKTWEGRELFYAVVASRQNLARIDEIRGAMKKLSDPRLTNGEAANGLIGQLPAVIWLGYGVHGNEISSPDAAMLTAYHLLAARNDPTAQLIRDNVVVLIDPLQNPDGRDRFVHNFRASYGIEPNPDRLAAEHDEPWPGGRTNHYLFDLNRDWFAITQPETKGRVLALQDWYPLVFVDLHEMGGDSSYYFAPEAVPYNPHLAADQRHNLELFGRNNAKWFDQFGFDYFTREVYDAFYPGYGASWPAYYGAVAMTYEQASARGMVWLRSDGDVLHFRDGVRHHFVASLSTAETAARFREKLLRDFYEYRVSAIEEGEKEPIREFVIPYRGDTSMVDHLGGLLALQGVEVYRSREDVRVCGSSYPTGSLVIPLAQPAKRFVRNLLDLDVPMDSEFVAEQERRRKKRMGDQIYDVTAWSLPLQFGIEAIGCGTKSAGARERVVADSGPAGRFVGGAAKVAYVAPWGTRSAAQLLAAALRDGLNVLSHDQWFRQGGRDFPRGSLIFKVEDNPADLEQRLRGLAVKTGAEIIAADSSWVEAGFNWGSRSVVKVRAPHIALAWDEPTRSNAAGATRFVIERVLGYPVTPIRTNTLARADLRAYQVLILPNSFGSYSSALGSSGVEALRSWVRAGGTLIALDRAVRFLTEKDVGLLASSREDRVSTSKAPENPSLLLNEADLAAVIEPDDESPTNVAGVLLRTRIDADHWLTAGLPPIVHALYNGSDIYSPLNLDDGTNALIFEASGALLASGYLWEGAAAQLALKPFVMIESHDRGQVIAFVADPTQRAYLDGLNVLFANAVFRAPAHANPVTW